MREALRDIAPLLGVLLPAIAAFFMYRTAEKKKQADNEAAAKGVPVAIGGALASVEGAKLHVEQLQKAVEALDRVAAAFNRLADATKEDARWRRDLRDEVEAMRRAIEEIAQLMKRRQ